MSIPDTNQLDQPLPVGRRGHSGIVHECRSRCGDMSVYLPSAFLGELRTLVDDCPPVAESLMSAFRARHRACLVAVSLPRVDVEVEIAAVADEAMDVDALSLRERYRDSVPASEVANRDHAAFPLQAPER